MTPENWRRLRSLFEDALDLSVEERKRFVGELQAGDAELGAELQSLLRAHEQSGWTLDQPLSAAGELWDRRAPVFAPGKMLLDRFRIGKLLGEGGMGQVYEAFDLELGPVALKTIRPEIAGNAVTLARFRREVQLARRIVSPFVCRVHEIFVLPADAARPVSAFLTMELLNGITLADYISNSRLLPWREAEAIARRLCEGLQAIHDAGVIHRDLKTGNIMLATRNGATHPVIMDFGLARPARALAAALGMSDSSTRQSVVGTLEYMAPEQFEGAELSPATDIYALGIVLYEMVTGVHPFASDSTLGSAVRRGKRPASAASIQRGLPRRWDEAIGRCLEYEAKDRYQSAKEVAAELTRDPVSVANIKRKAKAVRTHPRISAALAGGIAACILLSILWARQHAYRLPPPEAAAWYQDGVQAMQQGTYLTAEHAFQKAVASDDRFASAHARLADVYNELGYYGKAKDELLRASEPGLTRNLPSRNRQYLEAIRATVLHNFAAAVRDYQTILRGLPPGKKADGYVDLGRAYEREGDLAQAIRNYREAEKLDPRHPAAFLRIGILEGRQNHMAEAEAAFATAESLYQGFTNDEGLAEIDYWRGETAYANQDLNQARAFLMKALAFAKLYSPTLTPRVLCALSAVAHMARRDKTAENWANQASQAAETLSLDYWQLEARCRLAMAYVYPWSDAKGHSSDRLPEAEEQAQSALRGAKRNRFPLVAADAQYILALIRNRRDQPQEAISFALPASEYYRKAGYFTDSTKMLILLIRAKRDLADFQGSLSLCRQGLDLEKKSGSPPVMIQLEEAVGTVYSELEQFPESLRHFEAAAAIARKNNSGLLDYEIVHAAYAEWQLGRYDKAEKSLDSVASDARRDSYLASSIDSVLAQMRLSQGRYRDVIEAANREQALDPGAPTDVDSFAALAYLHLHSVRNAVRLANRALLTAQETSNQAMVAQAAFASAMVYFKTSSGQRAKPLAESAQAIFARLGLRESEWRSLVLLARISSASGDLKSARQYATKALDIVSDLEHNWDTLGGRTYLLRPDVKIAMREAHELAQKRAA